DRARQRGRRLAPGAAAQALARRLRPLCGEPPGGPGRDKRLLTPPRSSLESQSDAGDRLVLAVAARVVGVAIFRAQECAAEIAFHSAARAPAAPIAADVIVVGCAGGPVLILGREPAVDVTGLRIHQQLGGDDCADPSADIQVATVLDA